MDNLSRACKRADERDRADRIRYNADPPVVLKGVAQHTELFGPDNSMAHRPRGRNGRL